MEDTVRVLRVVEYIGDRSAVEEAVNKSLHEERQCVGYVVRAATLGNYPEILTKAECPTCQSSQETK
jgi:hypothetical protein